MPDDEKKSWSVDIDTLKNWGVVLTTVLTLLGVINFATGKIGLYDGYATRIAKLEARDQAVAALADNDKTMTFQLEKQKDDVAGLKQRMENLASDVIQLRLNSERLRVLLEQHR